ncbi:unnamed protein product [Closterium sp. Yama58-4]|nr:unnamed protein product [Closterium sp. Yama58-4]
MLPPSDLHEVASTATVAAADSAGNAVRGGGEMIGSNGVVDDLAYTIPYGSDWWGLNDRFGMGGRRASEAALKRLSVLQLLARRKMRDLNSERAFKAQLSLAGITVQRASLPFCVLSQRTYRDGCAPIVYSINSSVPLNGAKCRPCSHPCAAGEQARALLSHIAPTAPNWPGPEASKGEVGVCDAARGWEKGWDGEFDAVMGVELAEGRRQVVREAMGSIDECVKAWEEVRMGEAMGSIEECEQAWDEFRALTISWDAPSPQAVCVRARMGGSTWVGGGPRADGRFATFLSLLSASRWVPASLVLRRLKTRHGGQHVGGGRAAGTRELRHLSLAALRLKPGSQDSNPLLTSQLSQAVGEGSSSGGVRRKLLRDDTKAHGAALTFLSLLRVNSQVLVAVEGSQDKGSQDSNPLLADQLSQAGGEGSSSGGVRRKLLRDDTKAHGAAVAPDTVTPDTVASDTVASDTVAPDTVTPGTVAPDTVAPETVQPGNIAPGTLAAGTGTVAPAVDAGVFRAWKEDLGRRIKGISISHRPLAWLLSEAEKEGAPIDVLLVSG